MFRIAIAVGLMLTSAIAVAQLGAGSGTDAYAHGHSPNLDPVGGAAGTPMHKSHVEHYRTRDTGAPAGATDEMAERTVAAAPR